MTRRVVVTGLGVVSALGPDLASTCAAIAAGTSAIRPPVQDGLVAAAAMMAEVLHFEARPHFRLPKALKLTNRPTRFAVAAATMALSSAGWPADPETLADVGVVIGSSGFDPQAADLTRAVGHDPDGRVVTDLPYFAERMMSGLNPLWLLVGLPNMTSSHVAMQVMARGPNSSIMNDWVAGVQSVGEAADWIRGGEAVAVLAGGADSAIYPHACASYGQAGLLGEGTDASAIFIPGEGAGILLLEEREHARARSAPMVGEICGYASASGPAPRNGADTCALDRTMTAALVDAGWTPSSVDVIGSSLVPGPASARAERSALTRVLGAEADRVQRIDYQRFLGHALAASGTIDLAVLLGSNAAAGPRGILFNAMGFGGQAVTLAVAGPEAAQRDAETT